MKSLEDQAFGTNGTYCRYASVLYAKELATVNTALGRQAETQELMPEAGRNVYQCLEMCFTRCPNLIIVGEQRVEDAVYKAEAEQRRAKFELLTNGF